MHDFRKHNIHGVDVAPSFVQLTPVLFDPDKFVACKPFPPSDYVAGSFDLVFSYSVFSHLSESAALAWIAVPGHRRGARRLHPRQVGARQLAGRERWRSPQRQLIL